MILGKYEIQEELGQGGFGTVYKALDRSLKRTVAVKVLHPNLVNDQTFLGRFRQEAQITAQLNHSNLVHIYDYGESEGHYYIVMSYMPGGSLKERIKNEGAFSKEAALAVIEQIAGGLEYSHKHHVIHRDLKPGNILFDEEGKACISDLGFAKLLRSDATASMSASGGIVGTPAYMAPEIWRGATASPATDIYSLACILVEMLTGERLFGGESTPEVMLKHFEPLHLPESLPEEWKAVLEVALEKKPEDRIQSVAEFLEQLKQAGLRLQKNTNQPLDTDQGESLPDKKGEVIPDHESREVRQLLQRSLDSKPVEMVFESENEFKQKRENKDRAGSSNELVQTSSEANDNENKPEPLNREAIPEEAGLIEVESRESKTQEEQGNQYPKTDTVYQGPQTTEEDSIRVIENREAGGSKSEKSEGEKSKAKTGVVAVIVLLVVIIGIAILIARGSNPKLASYPAIKTRIRETDGMEQVYVPAGNFIMGSDDSDAYNDEKPVRTVYLDAYWIDKYEVTTAQYKKCVDEGECQVPGANFSTYDDYPVRNVSWYDAQTYCEWANNGEEGLPTEAQWEKAARGTDGRIYPWGNQAPDSSYANYNLNIGDTTEIGSYEKGASPYGAMDMAGNVWEWVNDGYGSYNANDTDNPRGNNNSNTKVIRGGSWNNYYRIIRTANRLNDNPYSRYDSIGFRCFSSP